MKILIVGLGLIGGSYALGLTKKGHQVYGVDNNIETIKFAIENGFVLDASNDPLEYLREVDLLILGLYPNDVLLFIDKYHQYFKENLTITDVAGIKTSLVYEATKKALPAHFVGSHPMAGREKIGIKYATDEIFKAGNFLITPIENTNPKAVMVVKEIANDLEFKNIFEITPEEHDKMIAYTSQLTHAIAVSLVNANSDLEVKKFIGDSYRDLTRIAMINEKLWTELFKSNKKNLIEEINKFERELDRLKASLDLDDDSLEDVFISSTMKRGALN